MIRRILTLPLFLILIVFWAMFKGGGAALGGASGLPFIFLGFIVLFAEFYKSADMGRVAFGIDLTAALAGVILFTAVIASLVTSGHYVFSFTDIFMGMVAIGDAWLCPFNSMNTALLRRVAVGNMAASGTGAPSPIVTAHS